MLKMRVGVDGVVQGDTVSGSGVSDDGNDGGGGVSDSDVWRVGVVAGGVGRLGGGGEYRWGRDGGGNGCD
jgi:hypothetical protein